jgi:EAL domain-containing protein (putative c-di-GMP-specific phosphodiesterase class I)
MYVAKRAPGGAAVYADQDDQDGADELALIADLRRGLDHDELTVAYQPIVGMKSSEVTCLEALARWRHPKRGMVARLEFVPLAERTGLVGPLFVRVLETSLQQCRAWHDQGCSLEAVVNLSVRNLLDPELPRVVAHRLEAANARPEGLALEVTETMVMADPVRAIRALEQLVSLGVRLVIDDFGVGYSSLSYLDQLPAQSVKIDRSFISRVTRDRNKESIGSLVIELAHYLGMSVVAEGVEDRATSNALIALHCDAAQGHFVARPMGAEAIVAWMARGNTSTSGT